MCTLFNDITEINIKTQIYFYTHLRKYNRLNDGFKYLQTGADFKGNQYLNVITVAHSLHEQRLHFNTESVIFKIE